MRKPTANEKNILNQEEAIVHFELSRRKFFKLLKDGKNLPFMALYGKPQADHPY